MPESSWKKLRNVRSKSVCIRSSIWQEVNIHSTQDKLCQWTSTSLQTPESGQGSDLFQQGRLGARAYLQLNGWNDGWNWIDIGWPCLNYGYQLLMICWICDQCIEHNLSMMSDVHDQSPFQSITSLQEILQHQTNQLFTSVLQKAKSTQLQSNLTP